MRLLNVDELCDALRCGKNTAYTLIRNGTLNAVRIGRKLFVAEVEVERFIEAGGVARL